MPEEVALRPARRGDAPRMAEIYNQGIRARGATFETRERAPSEVLAWIDDPAHPVLVAERAGEVVGWAASFAYRPRECYAGIAEISIYVDREARGRRVGDSLMRGLLAVLEGAGFWKALSRVFPENRASLAMCARHGFREVGLYRRHAKLDGEWRDVVIVERLLGEAAEEA